MKKMLLIALTALLLAGCGQGADELYETARFEEQQFNLDHARSLYRRIVEEHPDSPYAEKAARRLEELEAQ
ncbi:MAG: hypothetical protein GWN87_09295 [Desulfuromonadales bacterium]|nr:hypothetical protein [Desulfuromonadales bacterium]NIS40667.1 hypothetical protein [Desulfuromonadales bacterium]